MKNFCRISLIIIIILFTCYNASVISTSCRQGLTLWYNSVIPVLLPFMLLTGVILNSLDLTKAPPLCSYLLALVIGLFCGFPTGTMVVSFLYKHGLMDHETAQTLLPICNNVSPMFLYGYIYSNYLCSDLTFVRLLLCLYTPQIIYTGAVCLFRQIRKKSYYIEAAATVSGCREASCSQSTSIIEASVHNITSVGVYMVIFSITAGLIQHYFPSDITDISTAFLEISSGVDRISSIVPNAKIKTTLIISLTGFGGLSALFQSHEMIKNSGLSFIKYILTKCLFAVLCATVALSIL